MILTGAMVAAAQMRGEREFQRRRAEIAREVFADALYDVSAIHEAIRCISGCHPASLGAPAPRSWALLRQVAGLLGVTDADVAEWP